MTNNVLLGGSITFSGAAPLTFNGTVTMTASLTLFAQGTTTIANGIGEFGGARILSIAGVGTLSLLSPNSTYSGGTVFGGGTRAQ